MDWIERIQTRYRETLTFAEIRKGVVALSRIYVEERRRIERGAVFDGAGKRAAFACYYSPLHFLMVRKLVASLGAEQVPARRILDLGCGLGVAAAAWSTLCTAKPEVVGLEKNSWAAEEARWLLAALGIRGRILRKPLQDFPAAASGDAIVAAYSVNELDAQERGKLLERLLESAKRGAAVLIVEPLAKRALPWWTEWQDAFLVRSGRADEWRLAAELPPSIALFDRASGLDHRELTARSLCLGIPVGRRR
jgi:SAM-dependent methyltransferase